MDPKTSTWPQRHAAELAELRRLLPAGNRRLTVANVGPGLAVKYLGRFANRKTVLAEIIRRFETGVRRLPLPDLCFENYEAVELAEALAERPFALTAVDINPRVVRVVVNALAPHAKGVVADLGVAHAPALAPLRDSFDVVFSFAMVQRVPTGFAKIARENIRSLVRPGGLLVGGGDFSGGDVEPIEGKPGFFRRRDAKPTAA